MTVSNPPGLLPEREVPLADALEAAQGFVAAQGLAADLSALGDQACVAKCVLRGRDGRAVAIGMAKGDARNARAGAVFEALEHLLTDR